MEKKPVVSIAMLVYNHERYLDHALSSIFGQTISVSFEIIIGEDCSSDNSRKIIDKWKERYPDILKPVYREKNIGMVKNTLDVIWRCEGEYTAWLEGDDFWTDSSKLQKQLEFLKKNRQYTGVVHNTKVVDADGKPLPNEQRNYPIKKEQDFTWKDFQAGYMPGQTATLFYRNIFREMGVKEQGVLNQCRAFGDSMIMGLLLLYGKIKILPDIMSAYRFVSSGGSNWNSIVHGKNYSYEYYQHVMEQEKIFTTISGQRTELKGWHYRIIASALLEMLRNRKEEDRKIFFDIWKIEKYKIGGCIYCCCLAFKHIARKIIENKKVENREI